MLFVVLVRVMFVIFFIKFFKLDVFFEDRLGIFVLEFIGVLVVNREFIDSLLFVEELRGRCEVVFLLVNLDIELILGELILIIFMDIVLDFLGVRIELLGFNFFLVFLFFVFVVKVLVFVLEDDFIFVWGTFLVDERIIIGLWILVFEIILCFIIIFDFRFVLVEFKLMSLLLVTLYIELLFFFLFEEFVVVDVLFG